MTSELIAVVQRMEPRNIATVARLCALAKEGKLDDAALLVIYEELRLLPPVKQLQSSELRCYTLGESILACWIMVPQAAKDDPLYIAREYILQLGDLVLFATSQSGGVQ